MEDSTTVDLESHPSIRMAQEDSAALVEANAAKLFARSVRAMGTIFTIYLYAREEESACIAFEAAFEEVERLEEALSNYRESSELSRINRLASQRHVTTDPEVFDLIAASLAFSRQTGGAFDVTVGPLMRAWGFFRGDGRYPSAEELRLAKENVGWEKVRLDHATRTVQFLSAGMELDLGAIGKGYAVDRIIELLRGVGAETALVNAGASTLYAMGAPPGKSGWTVRVPDPANRAQTVSTVTLRDASLSTSGSYEKFFELGGRRYCHVMDPRYGTPVQDVWQATLVASDSTTSDALSNAMFVMGPERGMAMLAGMPDSRGLWILGEILGESEAQQVVEWQWQHIAGDATSRL